MEIPETAHALRPVRIKGGVAIHYTGTTFPGGPREGCELTIRRIEAFGYLQSPNPDLWVDVLDEIGDILKEIPITKRGFEYLRRTLKFVKEPSP